MAEYRAPRKHNGFINTVFNIKDYIKTNSIIKYIPNSLSTTFTNAQTYDYLQGQIYTLGSDSTVMTTLSFINLPKIPQTSYVFTFILTPSLSSKPYYILPNTNFVSVNGISTALSGLSNITLPTTYTTLIQQVTIINTSTFLTPLYNAVTSIVGYIPQIPSLLLMAVGGGSSTQKDNVIYSTDNGLTWAINQNASSVSLAYNNARSRPNYGNKVLYNATNNMWSIVTVYNYMYSTDYGVTWTYNNSLPFNMVDMVYNGNMYLCFGNAGSVIIWYSYDGINWSACNNSNTILSNGANTAIYNNGRWLCVGKGGGKGSVIYSTDGITWAYNTNGGDKLLTQGFCISYSGSMYLVGGQLGSHTIIYSTDGINWFATTNASSIATSNVYSIEWNGTNQWVAIGNTTSNTGVVMYSSDGMNWTLSTSGSNFMNNFGTTTNNPNLNNFSNGKVSWYNNAWIVGGASTTSSIIHSTDGINWTASNNNIFNTIGYGCNGIASGVGNLPATA